MAKCKLCGREIILVETVGGRSIPCDPGMKPYWEMASGHGRIVTPDGKILACKLNGWPDTAAGMGYIPHMTTCPKKHTQNNKEK